MAEGEDPFAYKDPDLDDNLDNDDDQEVDRTQPFHPGAASTPYYRGEQYEMQTMMHKQSGLPDVMEDVCKYLSFWNLLECKVTQCLCQNFLRSRYGAVWNILPNDVIIK